MATSNIKAPDVIRSGYVKDWNVNNLNLNRISCELDRYSTIPILLRTQNFSTSIIFYRWIQPTFIVRKRKKLKFKKISKLALFNKFQPAHLSKMKYIIRRHRFGFWKQQQIQNAQQFTFSLSQLDLIKHRTNELGLILQNLYLCKKIAVPHIDIFELSRGNLFVKATTKLKYGFDAVHILNLLSNEFTSIDTLGRLIVKAMYRNSRREKQRQFFQLLTKLPAVIRLFESKKKGITPRSWNWVIKVTGKLAKSGRTSNMFIRPLFVPFHTINIDLNYREYFVNLKLGTFSIKVWHII